MSRDRLRLAALLIATGVSLPGCGAEHLMLAEVPAVENLGSVSIVPESAPVIAPDGTSILYVQAVAPSPPVVSRNLATGVETTLFNVPLGSSLWTANYRTGSLLFSVASGGGGRHIVEYSLSGATIRNFDVPAGFQDYNASISPDGSTLAFVRRDDGTGTRTLSVRTTSSGSSPVTPHVSFSSGEVILAVGWIDGTHILISAQLGASTVVNKLQNLTTGIASNVPGLGLNATPDPSGQHLALLAGATGGLDIWLSDTDGRSRTRLTESPSSKLGLNWSADGRAIVYITRSGSPVVASLEVLALPPLQ